MNELLEEIIYSATLVKCRRITSHNEFIGKQPSLSSSDIWDVAVHNTYNFLLSGLIPKAFGNVNT